MTCDGNLSTKVPVILSFPVKGRIIHIIVLTVHFVLGDTGAFGKALIMHDLPDPWPYRRFRRPKR